MIARDQLRVWGNETNVELFISVSFGGTSPTIDRALGSQFLSRIETVDIDDANALALRDVDGIRIVTITGAISGLGYRVVISPTAPFLEGAA